MRLLPRWKKKNPSALGALALSGAAAVALAGCAVVSAPANGAAGQPSGSASSGTGLTVARSGTKPAPTPHQRAVADAGAIFASFAVPHGARKLPSAPSVDGGALKDPDQTPGTPDLVDKAGWWLAPGTPQQVLAWEAAHLPHRFSSAGSSSGSGPSGAEPTWDDSFSLPDIHGVLNWRELLVEVVADGSRTAVLVDAQVSWIPARPAGEKVPPAAKAVTISEDLGGNQGSAKPPKPVTITSPAKVRALVALIDGLPLTPPGVFSCPAGFGDSLTLTFRAGPRTPALAVATAELSGCQEVDFTLGGKPQPTLGAASGPQILKIAGLPWKIPSL
jgi:hypothetical protein